MAGDCIFCQIASGEIETELVWETDHVVAFRDLHPQAPTHLLIIPRKHIVGMSAITPADSHLLADIGLAARGLAERFGLTEGFRLVTNNGQAAGQTVPHLHFHLLAGRELAWPPG